MEDEIKKVSQWLLSVILLAEKDGLCVVDCDDKKGFIIVNAENIYAWDKKWISKRCKS